MSGHLYAYFACNRLFDVKYLIFSFSLRMWIESDSPWQRILIFSLSLLDMNKLSLCLSLNMSFLHSLNGHARTSRAFHIPLSVFQTSPATKLFSGLLQTLPSVKLGLVRSLSKYFNQTTIDFAPSKKFVWMAEWNQAFLFITKRLITC